MVMIMKMLNDLRWSAAGLLLLALPALLGFPGRGGAQESFRLSGDEVGVYNLAGRVEVVGGSGSEVVVQVMPGGRDAQRLEMEVTRVDGREALVVRYPDDRIVYPEMGRGSRTQLRIRSDGTWGGGGGDRVEIRGSGDGMEAWADLRITVPAGRDLAVYLAVGETEAEGVQGDLLIDTGSGDITARQITGDLNLDTGSGEVWVEGVRGDLLVDTGSGDVRLTDVQGGDVMVDTGSGEVEARDVGASAIEVDTGSGGITLSQVSAPEVSVDTGSGEVEVELLADIDDLVIDTGSGSVTVRVPEGIGAEIVVDTGSGGIEVDIPLEVREFERDHIRGTVGDGRGRIHIDTGSGEVRLISR